MIALVILPRLIMLSPSCRLCGREKNESAHDYSLRFEAVLDKIPVYEESWVKNIFVWGLHPNIAQEVNMKKSENAQQGNGAGEEGRCGHYHVKEARSAGCWVPGTEKNSRRSATRATAKTRVLAKQKKQTKTGSLATLEHLEVSPSAQVVIRRGTG